MLVPINLLPWQQSLYLIRQRRYQQWTLISLPLIVLVLVIGHGWLATISHRLQVDLNRKQDDLHRWQPMLQQWQQVRLQQRHLADVKRWQQQWYCRWQNLLNTLPTEISWQQAVFSFDRCHLQGQLEDPAVLNQWAKHLSCRIHQQHLHRLPNSNLFDFETDLTWP